MDENKNQTAAPTPDGIVVKDLQGTFKVLSDGELKDLDALLSSTAQQTPQAQAAAMPSGTAVDFPKFTDLAEVPADPHFKPLASEQTSGEKAEHHFHPEDKVELERELEKLNTVFALNAQKQYSVIKIAQKLIEKHGLKFSEQESSGLAKALLSYFRQMRSFVETRAVLTRPKLESGFGISAETADHMMSVVKHLKEKIEENDGVLVEAEPVTPPPPPVTRVVSPTPAPVKQAPPEQQKPEPPKPEPPKQPQQAPVPELKKTESVPPKPAEPRPVQVQQPVEAKKVAPVPPPPVPKPSEPATDTMPKMNRPPISTFKPPIIEIKRPQVNAVQSGRPTGRVEELALMDMATWRMLDPDPRIRAGKILGKIQNLEQESLTRKSQGIQAWRSNEVYQHYLALGQMSLEQKKDVAEVIQAVIAQGQQTLSLEEFEAVSDLNRMLRF